MKKTQWISLFMTIKKNFVSFCAISMFICLGISIFCGMSWGAQASINIVDRLAREGKTHFFELTVPLGLDEESLSRFLDAEEITQVEGINRTDAFFDYNGKKYQATIQQISQNIDLPQQVVGELPKKAGEIAVGARFAKLQNIQIGDVITFFDTLLQAEEHGMSLLTTNTFTVTGFMEISTMSYQTDAVYGMSATSGQPLDCIMFVHKDSFDEEATGGYRQILLRGELFSGEDLYSDEFAERLDRMEKEVQAIGNELATKRFLEIERSIHALSSQFPQIKEQFPIKDYGCSILSMRQGVDYIASDTCHSIMQKTMISMASLFLVVALMVCYSVIARMIHDHAKLIGTKKALGMSVLEIQAEYLLFSMLALVSAAIAGVLVARFIVEPMIIESFRTTAAIDFYQPTFSIKHIIIILLIEIFFVFFATIFAVQSVSRRNAILLLNGEQTTRTRSRFYEKWKLYQNSSILMQTIVNNFFNDKRRVLSTIVGIAGSASLLVTAFTYADVANANVPTQFRDFYHFNYYVSFDPTVSGAREECENILLRNQWKHSLIHNSAAYLASEDGETTSLTIFVDMNENDNQGSFQGLITPTICAGDKDKLGGFYLSHSIYKSGMLDVGEEAKLITYSGEIIDFVPNGFFTTYQPNAQALTDKKTYEELMGKKVEGNMFLTYSELSMDELLKCFEGVEGFLGISDPVKIMEVTFEQVSELTGMMKLMYASLSAAMAFMVLLNLLRMFVDEKKNELIVLMINGYETKAAKKYIYCDTILLTLVGIVIGIFVGELVGNLAVSTFTTNTMSFQSRFVFMSAGIGAIGTIALTFVMSLLSLREIPRLKLTDLTK